MKPHPFYTGLYLNNIGKEFLFKLAQSMADKAREAITELPEEERESFYDYCDEYLQSGAYGLKYALANTFIPAALGLEV